MPKFYYILVINPGSTSTKVALYRNENEIFATSIPHSPQELIPFKHIVEQKEYRTQIIEKVMNDHELSKYTIHAVVGRGGLLRPILGGTYLVNHKMLTDLSQGRQGEHASNLGGIIGYSFATRFKVPAFIVDPVVVDELEPIARISGHPKLERRSIFHALNQRAVAIEAARTLKKSYQTVNLIVAHLGGGISVGCHVKGRVVDVNNALNGEGPFSPDRTGGLPVGQLVKYCFSGKYSKHDIMRQLTGQGGMIALLGTNDMTKVKKKIRAGNQKARLVVESMAYQVAKEIGSLATVSFGKIDAIVLTGGLAFDQEFVQLIKSRIQWLTKVLVYPGEREMLAMAQGVLRVLNNQEPYKVY